MTGLDIDALVTVCMTAAALGPLLLLLLASAPMFAHAQNASGLTFEYWSLLVVLFVLGTAFLVARVFSAVLARQIRPLVAAASAIAGAGADGASARSDGEDLGTLAARFDRMETALFESRQAALARIEALERENARLRDAAQAHTRFLSDVSHEIRTPLSAMVSAARIIQRYHEQNGEVVDRFGETIVAEGNRLVGLLSDLLDLVKIQSGTLRWEDEELQPAALVADALKQLDGTLKRHEIQIHVDVPARLPALWADRKRIGQVIENLLRNAVKSTPAHGRIEVRAFEEDGGVHFVVSDTGAGLPPELLEQLFGATGALPSLKRKAERVAAGLGLALCRDIVARYRGRIWGSNGPRCGTELHFVVPSLAVRATPLLPPPARRPLRVLLVMKNSVLAECALRALRLEDVESRVCTRLQDALMMLATWTPEVMVVSPSFAWQLGEPVQQKIRKLGVQHILMFSQQEGFVEISPPTQIEPLVAAVRKIAPVGSRVLFVEDDPDYGAVVEFELSQAGYVVEREYNGIDGLAAVERGPALLVLDLVLPQMDGFTVLERMRERGIPVPTVVLTALDDPSLGDRLRNLGAAEVFFKFELILAAGAHNATRVRDILTPVLAANPSEVSREAGLLATPPN
jgi:signal transduction histidine kinase/DNA-binding response OmpR family regulator